VREDGAWVGGAAAFPFVLSVPGGRVSAAGVTAVSVLPTHRRRGLLREMMGGLLADAREREEPVAILWAAESAIYGRFGYGMATPQRTFRLARAHAAFRPGVPAPRGRVVALPADAGAAARLAPVADREHARRPGVPVRDARYWRHGTFGHQPEEPGDRRVVVYEGATGDEGYALHRVIDGWDDLAGLPDGRLEVEELVATTPAAAIALWRFLLDVDLMATTLAIDRPPDDPLPRLLADPRRLEPRVSDGVWVALLDVPAALAARTYAVDGALTLEVAGAGTFRLEGGPEGASCAPTSAAPDLALSLADLGALYLGGVLPGALAEAGRLEERTSGAMARATTMLLSPRAPWCPFTF